MTTYRVILTDTGKQDLRDIAAYIARQAQDREIGKRFAIELRERCKRLNSFPQIGALPKDHVLRALGYRFVPYREYLIFYEINEDAKTVSVFAIFNSKKDYWRMLR